MIVVATDEPLDARNLKRLAARAILGMARVGSSGSNGSGNFAIGLSTDPASRIPAADPGRPLAAPALHNDAVSPLFQAAIEATEEAISTCSRLPAR